MKTRRWDFVSAHAGTFGVQRICRVLQVSRSGYYRWIAGAKAREVRRAADAALVAEIREVHTVHRGTYGVRRVHAELRGFGHTVNRKRVERLMRLNRIEGRHLRRRKRTTIPVRFAPPAPDLVHRDFTAGQLDEKWCGDITYVQVGGTWLYLACVLDICSRRVLGYSMASHMRTELVIDALKMAVMTRGGHVGGVIFHADRGSQYTSAAFAQVCDELKIRRSMGRVGSSYDNALAESFWGDTYKALELFQFFADRADLAGDAPSVPATKSWSRMSPWLPWMGRGSVLVASPTTAAVASWDRTKRSRSARVPTSAHTTRVRPHP
ncbi:hypothetical protein GCM10010329_61550 [Streptomyces spiroverticillatus]|uniref:Integrase catalytic domain-containing protein n=1 Tax=Streptomyces finlayi TaxID=67296 RepID=A0A918X6X2_9ACTN|nr:hypothetical protein GCM10010329_61550 [Streptomyces spiroverticillatus]GHD15123.1 hypothetical protein GCM10010334_74900 [Streptomyces finlayi]